MYQIIQSDEQKIIGSWTVVDTGIKADQNCERIEFLVSNFLNKITTDESGWDTLYQNPEDGKLWVLFYPDNHLHDGGPPSLKLISNSEAQSRFSFA